MQRGIILGQAGVTTFPGPNRDELWGKLNEALNGNRQLMDKCAHENEDAAVKSDQPNGLRPPPPTEPPPSPSKETLDPACASDVCSLFSNFVN